MTPSLRKRLLTGIITGSVISLAIFSLGVYLVIRAALLNQFDASLASVARILAASVELDGDEIELEFEVAKMPDFQSAKHPTYYQLWKSDGAVVARSPLLDANDLPKIQGDVDELVFAKALTPEKRRLRTVGLKFTPRLADGDEENHGHSSAEQTLTLVVARDATEVLGRLTFLRWLLISAAATVTILSLVIAAAVVRKGLAPLNAIAAEIAAIDQKNLAARIVAARAPSEIVPIKDTLNDLLARLEEAFKRERRFTADVAHEFRTPLAGLCSTIEVALSRQRDAAEYQTALSICLAIVGNMHAMVKNLLMLARLDARQITLRTEQIRLAELLDSAWRQFAEKADQRQINFNNDIPTDLTCQSDPEHLAIVFRNLLENAAEYTNQAGQIRITAQRTGDSLQVTFSNTGCKLTDDQVGKVLDSFWRADESRSDPAVHSGLGLALVKRIITALNGDVTAKTDKPDTFIITLTLSCQRTHTGQKN